ADDVDWSRFAYTQYVTNKKYLCNSVMLFETLQRLGSKASRVMMYPSYMLPDPTSKEGQNREAKLIITARDSYGVELVPIQIQHREERDETWADSFTKLLAFNQTQYERVLALDSDSVVLQPMDELFLTPPCPVAMPRAYWLLREDPPRRILSSQLVLLQPSAVEFERIQAQTDASGTDDYDMEIVNQLYLDSATVLPHRPYDLLTGEFRSEDHSAYLGSDREEWDPVAALKEAKFLHFSDWPMPKPWEHIPDSTRKKAMPKCEEKNGKEDCTSRDIWNKIYDDFRKHR
ncbi:nucleotide-diphospho-sugar transferase, partial [Stachybotrys elegans]